MSDRSLVGFVVRQVGVEPAEITVHTTLFGDLGLDGDDAVVFFDAFKREFGVNLDGYRHDRHFRDEGMWPWEVFRFISDYVRAIRGEDPHKIAGLEPITIARLMEAARSKCWR